MHTHENERPSTPKARQGAARRPAPAPARTSDDLTEPGEAAGLDGLMLRLQRTAGNQAVSALINDSSAVVARQPAAPVATHVVDDMHTLQQLTPMTLIMLYISTDAQFHNGEFAVPQANAAFTKDWIFPMRPAILELIAEKMESQHDRAGVYREMLPSKPGDPERIGKIRDLLTNEYRQGTKGRLTEEEGRILMENTKLEIVDSLGAFGYACQNQKSEVRAEMAEEAELFAFILEIAFSFIPVAGSAVGKGIGKLAAKGMKAETIEALKKGAEMVGAKEMVEGTLKGAQREIKAAHSSAGSHKSEVEQFIDSLEAHAREAGQQVRHGVDRMTYAEMTKNLEQFSGMTVEVYEGQIAKAVEKFKKSAGHVGETRAWEYGQYKATMGGDTQAAKINTGQGERIALITYEMGAYGRPIHDQPVWLDWVPRDMEEITVAKSKKMYGVPIELGAGAYKIPPEYMQRWLLGMAGAAQE